MRNKLFLRIKAFTIFELTVVMAIMSTLITIIMFAYNRFNEQIKLSTELNNNLNDWHLIRANMWNDLFFADSINLEDQRLNVYRKERKITYYSEEEKLVREYLSNKEYLKIGLDKIEKIRVNDEFEKFVFHLFLNEDQKFTMAFTSGNSGKNKIDEYFRNLNNQNGDF